MSNQIRYKCTTLIVIYKLTIVFRLQQYSTDQISMTQLKVYNITYNFIIIIIIMFVPYEITNTHCLTCGEGLTVKHTLLHCRNYADTKTSLNILDNLYYEALEPSLENCRKIIMFLQRNKHYNLI